MKVSVSLVLLIAIIPKGFAQFEKYESRPSKILKDNPSDQATPTAPTLPTTAVKPKEVQEKKQEDEPSAPVVKKNPEDIPVKPVVKNIPEQNIEKSEEETLSKKDAFGRQTGIKGMEKIKEEKKYVNLNPETAFGPEVVTSFDFPDTSLTDFTKHIQKLTGINLIIDKALKGKISISAPSPITVGDAWRAYLTALNMNGYALVKTGAFYKIVQSREIRHHTTKMYTGIYSPDTENYMMKVIPLKNINANEVGRKFRPFLTRWGRIMDIAQTNTILVLETGTNINRIMRMLKILDVPGHEESLQIISVKNTSAQEIAKLLDEILKGQSRSRRSSKKSPRGRSSGNISKIIAEPRTNSIIAMANDDGAQELRVLIKKLDVKQVSFDGGQIHVHYLNYGDAETLAKTLSSLVSGNVAGKKKNSRFSSRRSSSSNAGLFHDKVKITADKSNNAIVVTASSTDYLIIQDVIKKLDIPRDQVYVEGMIMETLINKSRGFGVSIVGAYGTGAASKAGVGDSSDLLNLITNNITSLGGLFVGGGIGKPVTYNVNGKATQINSVNGLITAVASNNDTNILATPQILALDNEEAIFEVGETIPIAENATAANGNVLNSIKQQPITLKLKITPQINKITRFIRLKIDQKVEDFSQRQLSEGLANQGVATTTRNAVTTVVVRDRDTIAMGGLMRDKEVSTEAKVPLLGDIPILGWLFKKRQKTNEKVNLLFFLTPKIMTSYQKATAGTVKDVLNRRSHHLKNVLGSDDPFAGTAKALYDKAKRQEIGPLFEGPPGLNLEREDSKSDDINKEVEEDILLDEQAYVPPNYQAIYENTKNKKEVTIDTSQ